MRTLLATILGVSDYWIQWTHDEDEVAALWAHDPEANEAVEVLRVREK